MAPVEHIVRAFAEQVRGGAGSGISLPGGHGLPPNTPNISVPLFFEYEAVLKRKGMAPALSVADIDAISDFVLSKSRIRKIYFLWRPFLKDLKDDHLLEVAVESNSKYIVTFNVNDFKGIEKFGVKAVTPQEYLKLTGIMK